MSAAKNRSSEANSNEAQGKVTDQATDKAVTTQEQIGSSTVLVSALMATVLSIHIGMYFSMGGIGLIVAGVFAVGALLYLAFRKDGQPKEPKLEEVKA